MDKILWRYDDLVRQNDVDIVVPDGIETIDNEAFSGHRYKSITIPESVTQIGRYAFAACRVPEIHFKSVNINVSSTAFEQAKIQRIYAPTYKFLPGEWKLVAIRTFLEQCVNDINMVKDDNDYKAYIKRNYRKMIADSPEYLHLFIYLVYANILLPDEIDNYMDKSNVAEIKALLLEYKNRIVSPELNNKLQERKTELEMGAPVTVDEAKKNWRITKQKDGTYAITKYKGYDENVIIPAQIGSIKVTRIDNKAFASNARIVSVTIPCGITHIGWQAFSECANLEGVILPETVKVIEDCAFEYCSSIKEITIPSKVKSIKAYTFYQCKHISIVTIQGNISVIGDSAFYGCRELSSINLPSSVKRISSLAFDGCSSLKHVNVSNSVTGIGTCAFEHGTTMHVQAGSYAEEYAKKNGIKFVVE